MRKQFLTNINWKQHTYEHRNYILIVFSITVTYSWRIREKRGANKPVFANNQASFHDMISLVTTRIIHQIPLFSLQCQSVTASCLSPIIIISHTSNGIIVFRFVFSLSKNLSQFWWRSVGGRCLEELCKITSLSSRNVEDFINLRL